MGRVRRLLVGISTGLFAMAIPVVAFRVLLVLPVEGFLDHDGAGATLFRRVGTLVTLLIGYRWFGRHYEGRGPATELGWRTGPALLGAGTGMLLIGFPILVLFLVGQYEFVGIRVPGDLFGTTVLILVLAMVEEVIFRGVLFRTVEGEFGTGVSLLLSSIVFGGMHAFNDSATPLSVASVSLISCLWTCVFVASRNLWVTGLHHGVWNLTILLAGVPLSGQTAWRSSALIETCDQGWSVLTGGAFGPEDSLLTIVVVATAFAALASHMVRRGLFVSGTTPQVR